MSQKDTPIRYSELAAECDLLLKAGNLNQVRLLISKLQLLKVPRNVRAPLAKICRRAGLIAHGLRLLHPIIRQPKTKHEPASPVEICEYAVLLSRNGSVDESLTLLQSVDPGLVPESLLYTGLCHIIKWNYAEAADYFLKFLSATQDDYSKMIAQVNLASCYVVLAKLDLAEAVLNEAIEKAKIAGATRLVGNCFELLGQVRFWQNDFPQARLYLKRASEIFGQTKSYDQHLILKTEAIMEALEKKSAEPLVEFRKIAMKENVWESVREADLFLLKVRFDQKKLDHLIYGTPLLAYRQRIQTVVGRNPSQSFTFGVECSLCLDLISGELKGQSDLLAGRKVHRILASLLKDFYHPRNLGQLFSDLYPGEYFDINSSPARVRQLMKRARIWLKENKIPAAIEHEDGQYRFVIHGRFGIRIPLETPKMDFNTVRWSELQTAFSSKVFTAEQACEVLRIQRSTFRRLMAWGLENGIAVRIGRSSATRYQIAEISLKKSQNQAA